MALRRRTVYWVFGVVATLLAGAGITMFFVFRDTATPLTRDEAAGNFGGILGDGTPGSAGVYVYTTTGFEEVDAFGGGHHPYPAETYLTIEPIDCGSAVRWQPLRERSDEHRICDDGRLEAIDSYHEWFGVADRSLWECGEDAHTVPRERETSWSFVCEKPGDSTQAWEFRVVGTETIRVDGEEVEALHIASYETLSGRTNGGSESHEWLLPGTLLPVRRTSTGSNTTDSPVGPVTYFEEFEITLQSLDPLPIK